MRLPTILTMFIVALILSGCTTKLYVKDSKITDVKHTFNDTIQIGMYSGRPVPGRIRIITVAENTPENYSKLRNIIDEASYELINTYSGLQKVETKVTTKDNAAVRNLKINACVSGGGTFSKCDKFYTPLELKGHKYIGGKKIIVKFPNTINEKVDDNIAWIISAITVRYGRPYVERFPIKVKRIGSRVLVYFYEISDNYRYAGDAKSFMEVNNLIVEKINTSDINRTKTDSIRIFWKDL